MKDTTSAGYGAIEERFWFSRIPAEENICSTGISGSLFIEKIGQIGHGINLAGILWRRFFGKKLGGDSDNI